MGYSLKRHSPTIRRWWTGRVGKRNAGPPLWVKRAAAQMRRKRNAFCPAYAAFNSSVEVVDRRCAGPTLRTTAPLSAHALAADRSVVRGAGRGGDALRRIDVATARR